MWIWADFVWNFWWRNIRNPAISIVKIGWLKMPWQTCSEQNKGGIILLGKRLLICNTPEQEQLWNHYDQNCSSWLVSNWCLLKVTKLRLEKMKENTPLGEKVYIKYEQYVISTSFLYFWLRLHALINLYPCLLTDQKSPQLKSLIPITHNSLDQPFE